MSIVSYLDRRFYPGIGRQWDDDSFRELIAERVDATMDVLDLGAGAGTRTRAPLVETCRFLAGVDPDPVVLTNSHLDEARVQVPPDYSIPFEDARFDLVCANSVIEHVGDAAHVFREVDRVLRPGGQFVVKTPNKWGYFALVARMVPNRLHPSLNARRGRNERDTFPTTYPCNTITDLERTAIAAGMTVDRVRGIEGRPEYLRMSWPTYLCGIAWERFVNSSARLERLRSVLLAEFKKNSGC